jgi:hypothetical protein
VESLNRRQFVGKVCLIGSGVLTASQIALLTGCSTTWIDTAIGDLPVIVKIAETVVAIIAIPDPGLDPAIGELIKLAATGASVALDDLKKLIQDYKGTPSEPLLAKIKAGILDAQKNFSGIVAQLHAITSSKLVATLSQAGSLSLSVLASILALLPPSMTAMGSSRATSTAKVRLMTSSEIKHNFNTVAKANGYSNQV